MKEIKYLKPFGRMCITLGMLPSSYKESLTYEEQLLWLFNYFEKTLIPAIDENAEALKELQVYYEELKSYVEHYFDNLDVQTEIDNKLDEMAEQGQLADIIAQYLGLAGVLAFDTLEDLEEATNIVDGSIALILGKDEFNDGKSTYYKIREIKNSDVVDGDNLIAIDYDDQLVGEKIKNTIYVHQVDGAPTKKNIYVDSVNGNDNNSGTTIITPLKTLDKVFEKFLNKGNLVLRIFMSPGTYSFNRYTMNASAIHFFHLGNTNDDVIINFTNPYYSGVDYYNIAFYNCHINFHGNNSNQKLILNGGTSCSEIYIEGGSFVFANCEINDMKVTNYGSYIGASATKFPEINGRSGNFYLYSSSEIGTSYLINCKVDINEGIFNPSLNVNNNSGYYIHSLGSDIVIHGTTYIDNTNAPVKNGFIRVQGGKLVLESILNQMGSETFTGNVDIVDSILIASQTRYDSMKALANSVVVDSQSITSTLTL